MKQRIQFIIIYFAFWVIFFLSARFIFLSYHIADTKLITLEQLWGIFTKGARMDLSMAGYLCVVPYVFVAFSNFLKKGLFEGLIFSYTFISVFLVTFAIVVDLEVFNVWGNRLDLTPIYYLSSTKEALASAKASPILPLFLSFISLIIISFYIVYRILADRIYGWNYLKNWPFMGWIFAATALLYIPIRGGIKSEKLTPSSVYFSKNNFANIAALNPTWNFLYAFTHAAIKINPYTYLPKEELQAALKGIFQSAGNQLPLLSQKNPNILIVIQDVPAAQESIDSLFSGIRKPYISFPNMYASGDQAEEGLVALLSGFPSLAQNQLLEDPQKITKLPYLSRIFFEKGYGTEFYSLSPIRRTSILKPYLMAGSFTKIIDKNDFPTEMGVRSSASDVLLFDQFLVEHAASKSQPFFATILLRSEEKPTLSIQTLQQKKEALASNTQHLAAFFEKAAKSNWWGETLVIVVPANSLGYTKTGDASDAMRSPMYWTGGAIGQETQVVSTIHSQVDLPTILLAQLKMKDESSGFQWGKNSTQVKTPSWAFFNLEDGMGIIKPNGHWLYSTEKKERVYQSKGIERKDRQQGLAIQQKLQQTFIDL